MIEAIINPIFEFFIGPYSSYSNLDISLEGTAVILGVLSVWYAKKSNVLVYPTGMISTAIYVYLLLIAGLVGDFLINVYYFMMSVYGWYFWTQKREEKIKHPIKKISLEEKKWSLFLFITAIIIVMGIYLHFDKWNDWTAPVDSFTTAIFFVGMWLMARKKIEHWIFWIIGDIISIPLYLYKGMGLTSIQYIIFTIIAIFGYLEWKKSYNNSKQIA